MMCGELLSYLTAKVRESLGFAWALLALYVACLVALGDQAPDSGVGWGIVSLLCGHLMFTEGLKYGLVPLGQRVGSQMPQIVSGRSLVLMACFLGAAFTFSEPGIGSLRVIGRHLVPEQLPYLHCLLTRWVSVTIFSLGISVGAALALGFARIYNGWPLKPVVVTSVCLVSALSLYVLLFLDDGEETVSFGWDVGTIAIGPTTVPLVLAFGVAMQRVGTPDEPVLGVIALMPLFGACSMLALAIGATMIVDRNELMMAIEAGDIPRESIFELPESFQHSPMNEMLSGGLAMMPLIILLRILLLLTEQPTMPRVCFPDDDELGFSWGRISTSWGCCSAVCGQVLLYLGLSKGLIPLAHSTGVLAAALCFRVDSMPSSPILGSWGILVLAVVLAVFGGVLALCEPALQMLANDVRSYTHNDFSQQHATGFVAIGLAVGVSVAVMRQAYPLPASAILIPGYAVALVATLCTSELSSRIAWDLPSAATGIFSAPFLVSFGLAFEAAAGVKSTGFGFLAISTLFAILSLLPARFLIDKCLGNSAGAYASIDVKLGAPQDLFSFQDSTFESFELELDDLGTDENVCSEMQSLNGPNQSSFTL